MYQQAVECGMSKHDFYHSTIKDVNIYMYAYQKNERDKIKMYEYVAWLNGIYVRSAIGSCFDKKFEYPDNPLLRTDTKSLAEKTGKSEVEMNQELVMASMMIRQANANIEKELDLNKEGGDE